ncbi:hypothetical protein RvY_03071 [Ramazzottius varieornatus]|uniref:Uncharacterized protein n=1 Tax=Ramazzottius varieornatus TaxID=947166 RepID=A0A1D1UQ96_RAMVA|nr:hypothetical protein RvY_03071 [Ramazzottius varieornatus]
MDEWIDYCSGLQKSLPVTAGFWFHQPSLALSEVLILTKGITPLCQLLQIPQLHSTTRLFHHIRVPVLVSEHQPGHNSYAARQTFQSTVPYTMSNKDLYCFLLQNILLRQPSHGQELRVTF